jgi:hypothetical protein
MTAAAGADDTSGGSATPHEPLASRPPERPSPRPPQLPTPAAYETSQVKQPQASVDGGGSSTDGSCTHSRQQVITAELDGIDDGGTPAGVGEVAAYLGAIHASLRAETSSKTPTDDRLARMLAKEASPIEPC